MTRPPFLLPCLADRGSSLASTQYGQSGGEGVFL